MLQSIDSCPILKQLENLTSSFEIIVPNDCIVIYNQKKMNFLNKKYTSLHGSSPYQNTNSRSFLPSSSTIRESPSLPSNNCEQHPSEIVRHMCLQCVELLCSQCIGEHLEIHREANIIPKIMSIKQLRGDMDQKMDHIISVMNSQNPNLLDLEGLRKGVLDKVQTMRKDLIRAIDDWVGIMRNHLLSTLGFEEVNKVKNEMERLKDQISLLQQALNGAGQPGIVKKIFQIDAQKLKEGYHGMFAKYKELQQRTDFEITLNWKQIIKTIQSNISMKSKSEAAMEQKHEHFEQQSQKPRENYSAQEVQHSNSNQDY